MTSDRAGKPLRSIELRSSLYDEVIALRKQKLSYNRIIAEIQAKHGVKLSKSHISNWLTGTHLPTGSARLIDLTPSSELAYLIGVKMGDASQSLNKSHSHKITLRAMDKDFVEEFAKCLSEILRRSVPPIRQSASSPLWRTQASSVLLRHFLMQPFDKLKPFIEHSDACSSAFLKGFFDSEAGISGRSLKVSNGNHEVLSYVKTLLDSFGIQTTGPHLASKGGRMVLIKGKFYRQNKDMHYLYVRTNSLNRFREKVDFSLQRKAEALRLACGLRLD